MNHTLLEMNDQILPTFSGRIELIDWQLMQITGKDRVNFIQGQTTNDIFKSSNGKSILSARISRSGKVQSFFYLVKRDLDIILLIPKDVAYLLKSDFEKYIIMEDVTVKLLDSPIHAIIGPSCVRDCKKINLSQSFQAFFYGLPSVIFWELNNQDNNFLSKLIKIDEKRWNVIRKLSGIPVWGENVNNNELISESYLGEVAVDFNKGCFLGQEVVAKINFHKGPSYFPCLLLVSSEIDIDKDSKFLLSFFYIDGRKAGKVIDFVNLNGTKIFILKLLRDYRVEGSKLILNFKLEEDYTLEGTVYYLPFFKVHDEYSYSQKLYDYSLDLFAKNKDEEVIGKCVQLLEFAIDLNVHFADAYEMLGVLYSKMGKYKSAIEIMSKLLEVDAKSIMAHTNLSLYYMQLGDIQKAEEEKALATTKSFTYFGEVAELKKKIQIEEEQKRKEMKRRLDMFQQVLEIDQLDPMANYGLGSIEMENQNFQDAIVYLERALKSNQKYSVAYLALGKCLYNLKLYEKAKEVFEIGISIAAKNGDMVPANEMQTLLSYIK